MTKFVWLAVPGGGQVPVNPDQVQYLRVARDGSTELVFGALQGGMHTLAVDGDGLSITAALEAANADMAPAPPERAPGARAARRGGRGRQDTPPHPAPPAEPA